MGQPSSTDVRLPSIEDVRAAAARLDGAVHRTPILRSRLLSRMADCNLYLKPENLQRGGAYKMRGAYNKVSGLSPAEREAGVIAFSSGNHAQAVALAARDFGCRAVVVMPEDVAPVKRAAVESYGAEVVLAGTTGSEREAEARRLAAAHGYTVIPAFEDPHIIAGQGTVALEILEDLPQLDVLLVPIGGGGLSAGCALTVKALRPQTRVIGVEPEGAADAYMSFRNGALSRIEQPRTIADGLRAQQVGFINWEIIRRHLDDVVVVSEDEIRKAMVLLLTRTKLLAEPSGAVATAAALFGKIETRPDDHVAAVISGGNVEPRLLGELLTSALPSSMMDG